MNRIIRLRCEALIPGGWQPHKHNHENVLHVQRTSSHYAFPSCCHRLHRPGIDQFREAALLPLHHPCSIPAYPMLARFFPLPAAALLASISINKMTAIVFPGENILSGFPSTDRNASASHSLFPSSLCNIHWFSTNISDIKIVFTKDLEL